MFRFFGNFLKNFANKNDESASTLSTNEFTQRLRDLALEIDNANILQENLSADKKQLRTKIENLKNTGAAVSDLSPMIAQFKNLTRLTNTNSDKLVRLIEFKGALEVLIIGKTSLTEKEVDKIHTLFELADETIAGVKEATKSLVKTMDASLLPEENDDNRLLDDFDRITKHEAASSKESINLDEI